MDLRVACVRRNRAAMIRSTIFSAVMLIAAFPAVAQTADAPVCDGLFCVTEPYLAPFVLAASIFLFAMIAVIGVRAMRSPTPDEPTALIDDREWPVAMTRLDGTVVRMNAAMSVASPGAGRIVEVLGRIVGANTQTIYRMSRLAVQDGLAIEPMTTSDDGQDVVLTAQAYNARRLIWQIVPRSRLGSLTLSATTGGYSDAPFAYVRFAGLDRVTVNDLFSDVFAQEAIDVLRGQIDNGMLSAGRIALPGADGNDRLALSALKFDRGPAGDSHEIFLFIPDGETSGQVSAAETLGTVEIHREFNTAPAA